MVILHFGTVLCIIALVVAETKTNQPPSVTTQGHEMLAAFRNGIADGTITVPPGLTRTKAEFLIFSLSLLQTQEHGLLPPKPKLRSPNEYLEEIYRLRMDYIDSMERPYMHSLSTKADQAIAFYVEKFGALQKATAEKIRSDPQAIHQPSGTITITIPAGSDESLDIELSTAENKDKVTVFYHKRQKNYAGIVDLIDHVSIDAAGSAFIKRVFWDIPSGRFIPTAGYLPRNDNDHRAMTEKEAMYTENLFLFYLANRQKNPYAPRKDDWAIPDTWIKSRNSSRRF
ncbi:MAG: hypothetical protein A3F31_00385 [Candidatus Levybacteria bacterium RIFCSPHIGHO2_12_FULL_38_12]|nr:MAG: hypothetical protein A2770_03455 [Candidatus Levybacteria bacterium RIFCSPHIGHO2_01_FULL_38_12]OGH23216.1 MAG: hypothetical protein A3F31_00385 [Candidatus Levybacteria bacterium RIFCSPHIGHO2_12_FULL_38_12]OGH34494.1 MAG: hypothetical protein A3A47_00905 [Candidatus Levybacteria bacterium RIFCSPLOWO2_01_FULL_37_20]OGH44742.1 MAG: hypothetical protein A3J14_00265 [Candidatus Levybacteria bacterium RIFCSPLOWO2_02_FULL_37_18]